jgi:hypothetical protein
MVSDDPRIPVVKSKYFSGHTADTPRLALAAANTLLEKIVHSEDPHKHLALRAVPLLAVTPLRLVSIDVPAVPQRRRTPRRRVLAAFLIERRSGDRRETKPGIDGLLRMVLADDWK